MAHPTRNDGPAQTSALVTNIQGLSVHDGPGIRTTVFLKGCALACRWCANPECISPRPELGFVSSFCTRCGACLEACPNEAVSSGAGGLPVVDRARCAACGACVLVCERKGRVIHGKEMTVDEVFTAVAADKIFYGPSGGGVTVSGGEPLLCPRFILELFAKLRAEGIHTCLETSGCADSSTLLETLPVTDYVLFDLKLMDPIAHRRFTGKSNELILANARLLAASGTEFLFRMPLIPGINDDPGNIRETAHFLQGLEERARRLELMPYHRLGEGKYASIGRRYRLHGLPPLEPDEAEAARRRFEAEGITCTVST